MVVECGAGTTEVAVISLGIICLSKSARGGGEALDQSLIDHLKAEHRFHIGVAAAEALKLQISDVLAHRDQPQSLEVRGLDTASGTPRVLQLPASELLPVWLQHVDEIVTVVRDTLRETPPEISQDVLDDGITLTGGGAMAALLAERIFEETGVRTHIAGTPRQCVALGLQRILERAKP
jgi:rod shape-determining protein MreB